MAKNIYQVAADFERKLNKLAAYPDQQAVTGIIQKTVASAKASNTLLASVKQIDSVNVQNSIDNISSVYFQLVVEPAAYQQLINEPYKSEINNLLKPMVERALTAAFRAFEFKVKIGIVPV